MSKNIPNRVFLTEDELPKQYYNIAADMPNKPRPYLHPATLQPAGPQDLEPLFPKALIEQEMSMERYIDIPKEVREIYATFRPSPLVRAYRLEKFLGTPAKIYYKYEGTNPSGSHKLNTAIAQAFYNKAEGTKRISTETGAGQWGTALSIACAMFGLECAVYMVRVSYDQKPYRKILIQTYGADIVASPSTRTNAGRCAGGTPMPKTWAYSLEPILWFNISVDVNKTSGGLPSRLARVSRISSDSIPSGQVVQRRRSSSTFTSVSCHTIALPQAGHRTNGHS
jgi:predicted alternative tryptophan synthase beta-subunit